MVRTAALSLLAVAALVAPAAVAAAPASTARYFEIRAIVVGGTKVDVAGKLWIEGTKLGASAGCNSIGAEVTVDGNVVTIVGPTSMTEMACPGNVGDAEAALLKVLGLGRFTIEDGAWTADGGQIIVVEVTAPDPAPAVPPDQPISNDPSNCVIVVPVGPATGVDDGSNAGGTDPGAVGGSGSGFSGAGSSGGASTTGSGSTGTGVVEPDPGGAPLPTVEGRPDDRSCPIAIGKLDQNPDGVPPAPVGGVASASDAIRDTIARDALFLPLAIGVAVLLGVTVLLFVKLRPTAR
jgi:META domain